MSQASTGRTIAFFPEAAFGPALEYQSPAGGLKPVAGLARWIQWRPIPWWAVAVSAVALFTITQLSRVSEFIYWQF